jgi:hypothetical protein
VRESRKGLKSSVVAVSGAVLVVLLPARVQSAVGQVQISQAKSAAEADAETAEGKKFGEEVAQAFGREHDGTIQRCAKETKHPDLSDFDLFLRLDGTGVVDQAFEEPVTALATCVREKMSGWKVSTPPHAGFWVKVDAIAALVAGGPSDSDWQWLDDVRAPAFEYFMAVERNTAAYVTFRSYRDLYQDVPEAYVTLRRGDDALEALVVQPSGASIQQQLLELHIAEPEKPLGELLPKVKVQRRRFTTATCPAVRQQLEALSRLRLPLPERDIIVLHPVVYRLLVEFGGGTLDLSLVDAKHPAVRWAHDTITKVQRCREQP